MGRRPLLLLLLLPLGLPVAGATTVYKCTGSDGRVTFQDRPCARAQRQDIIELAAPAPAPPSVRTQQDERLRRKEEELAPFVERALARKPRMAELAPETVPRIESIGLVLERRAGKDYAAAGGVFADPTRGGAIPMTSLASRSYNSRAVCSVSADGAPSNTTRPADIPIRRSQ